MILRAGTEPRTDAANAQRFVDSYRRMVRWCAGLGGWLYFDGFRWVREEREPVVVAGWMRDCALRLYDDAMTEAERCAVEMVRASGDEKAAWKEKLSDAKKLATWARSSQGSGYVSSSLAAVREEDGIALGAECFDAWPDMVNTTSGELSTASGARQTQEPDSLLTKLTTVGYDEKATAPRWEKFLEEVLPDEETRGWLKRWAGSCLTGITKDRVVVLFVGVGANGKSVLLDTLLYVMGDYARAMPPELFVHRKGESAPPHVLAMLPGIRLAVVSELTEGDKLDTELLKRISGGDTIVACKKYCAPFEFKPQCKLVAATNHRPRVTDSTASIWDRLRVVEFPRRFEAHEQDKGLSAALRDEGPGILKWMVEGCMEWRKNGLGESLSVMMATQDLRESEDVLTEFFSVVVAHSPGTKNTMRDIYQAYLDWANDEKIAKPWSKKALSRSLRDRGYERTKNAKDVIWHGIAIRDRDGVPQEKRDLFNINEARGQCEVNCEY